MSPIERISRTLCSSGFDGYDPDEIIMKGDPPRGPVGEWRDGEWFPLWPRWMSYEPQARAVLQAIREPSEGMVAAVVQQTGDPSPDQWALGERTCERLGVVSMNGERACAELTRDWQAMIDAALSE